MRHPALLFLILILLIYGLSLTSGFALDDYHHLDAMEAFRDGRRDTLELYRFLVSDAGNAEARRTGDHPWWLADDVRYQHWRPLAEWTLYAQFVAFGRTPFGYRAITLALYWVGVYLTYQLLARWFSSEGAARWAALVFLALASHAIPVVFISAQSDIIALVLTAATMLAAERFASRGRWRWVAFAAVLYTLSLGFKEACLPVAALPGLMACILHRGAMRRRGLLATLVLGALGLAWLVLYARGGYGSNTLVMLDPIHRTGEYLIALPGRALLLLTSLVVPVNPFIFYFRPRGEPWLYVYAAVGAILLATIMRSVWRRAPSKRNILAAVVWIIIFLPLLVCTVPDDRILMLPSIGFAYLIGVWITGENMGRLRRAPIAIFIVIHAVCAFGVGQLMHQLSSRARENFRAMVRHAADPPPGAYLFVLDSTLDPQVLFAQSCFEAATGRHDVQVRYLSDSESLEVARTGSNTLALTDTGDGMFSSFLGAMAATRENPKRAGDVLTAGELTGRIIDVRDGRVRTVELTFQRNLDDPAYYFFRSGALGAPIRWQVPRGSREAGASDARDGSGNFGN